MSQKKQIVIDKCHTHHGGDDGHELQNLYFQETEKHHEFNLFDANGLIPTNPPVLKDKTDFSFTYDKLCWSVTDFHISEHKGKARGHWSAKNKTAQGDPETGTFQAQAGGTEDPELRASASASA